ncbi:hypothetical protein SPRG_09738 [Saprolegnia parasitica CBS 223.65]|uniref:Uncharacterized protein n=1 Tax=Saprolegnia parasitica (strain CBS 223.65) TaxID=695850 RepID=A0A067C395_SAPPC|nr:hypothetical protein SPRG_09738 [Saprolegnia parasitica CBS 223.65]KDO25008.1 hypothetical protein SPRG_09738 [Saprolegnia parasitica CBS 223.65]|eukprot:XP_012204277.1 hypothetical protein SPRG_09738 [Saprolegnia parasitica CBS 223.65]
MQHHKRHVPTLIPTPDSTRGALTPSPDTPTRSAPSPHTPAKMLQLSTGSTAQVIQQLQAHDAHGDARVLVTCERDNNVQNKPQRVFDELCANILTDDRSPWTATAGNTIKVLKEGRKKNFALALAASRAIDTKNKLAVHAQQTMKTSPVPTSPARVPNSCSMMSSTTYPDVPMQLISTSLVDDNGFYQLSHGGKLLVMTGYPTLTASTKVGSLWPLDCTAPKPTTGNTIARPACSMLVHVPTASSYMDAGLGAALWAS